MCPQRTVLFCLALFVGTAPAANRSQAQTTENLTDSPNREASPSMEKLSAKPAPASNSQPAANNPSRAKAKTKSRQTHAPTAIFEPAPVTALFAPERPANPAAGLSAEEKKKAEIEALGREIRDRQRQVDLLMRLYVTDVRKYLLNMQHHTNTESEKRVDSEQAELHQKALELRHLQEKLQSLQARVNATTAEGKP